MSRAISKSSTLKLATLVVCLLAVLPMAAVILELALLPGVLEGTPKLKSPPSGDAIPNFFVVENYLFRGAQPSPLGMEWLKKHRVSTIVDLREAGTPPQQGEAVVARDMGFRYVNLPVRSIPALSQLESFISIVEDARAGKKRVFVHCCYGSDRTGAFVGSWRLIGEHWRPSAAFAEMLLRGFIVHRVVDWRQNTGTPVHQPSL
ncbi:MAG: tyrosine-protein phosphatase [Cyanobacteria bacterium]|nr:tyrosine-protein phosphatase [Cyanobacteriota bacterium]